MKTSDIKGIIPPVITPMNNDPEQTVNHQALREQVERLLAGGVHGIFPMGTNGEAYALSFQEKEEILATVIDQVKGRVPVYAGTGCITTAETIRLSKRAEELGADALSIITPSFALASQRSCTTTTPPWQRPSTCPSSCTTSPPAPAISCCPRPCRLCAVMWRTSWAQRIPAAISRT